MRKKSILLTGGSGFLGFNLIKALSDNYKLLLILKKKDKKIKANKDLKIIYYKNAQSLNKLKKNKIDYIIHCATHYRKNHEFNDIEKMSDSNLVLGNIILELNNIFRVKKFLNFSTVWENYDGIQNNSKNLYSSYKQAFSNILNYYKKNFPKTKFYNIFLSETFGEFDKRRKLISILKNNYKKNKLSKIVSKNLKVNVLNVKDIIKAVKIILNKNIKSGDYVLKNDKNVFIRDIIKHLNKKSKKKVKIKYLSSKIISEKIYNYKTLPLWRPSNSKTQNIIEYILS